jgi:peptidyl-dipeptidase A
MLATRNERGVFRMDVTPHRLVESLEQRLEPLEVEFHEAYWDSQVSATPENDDRRSRLELRLREAKGDPDAYRSVLEALEEDVHEPLLKRRLELLRSSLTGNQMDEEQRARMVELSSEVESDFASFRPEVDGRRLTENEIDEILRNSDDEDERRRTWEASKEVGGLVAARVRELARVRNQAARELGFSDYYRMSLTLQEIPEEWLFDFLDDVDEMTSEPFRRWKAVLDERLKGRFKVAELRPWHYSDPFFQALPPDGRVTLDEVLGDTSSPDLALETFKGWGIDLSHTLSISDLYPREKKCQHAFCLDVDRTSDNVRILANVVPGERWTEVMLHESGHAAYDVCIDSHLPYTLRRAAHTFVTEAIALLSGRLARDPEWLTTVAGIEPQEVEPVAEELRAANAAHSLLFARWVLVMTHFERDLYSDPEQDLDSLWWDYVSRYQLVEPPPGRSAPDWAAKIHVAVAPVYYHNYLLGDILASQLRAHMEKECGGFVGSADAGAWMKESVFKHGSRYRWDELVEKACGEPLTPRDFAAELETVH